MESQQQQTTFAYSTERLPSINMLKTPCYTPSNDYPFNRNQSIVVSPPLTPLVSPSASSLTSPNQPKNKKSKVQNQQHKHVCHFQFCGWSFKRYEHLKRHMLVHTGERPYNCHFPNCGKSFSRSDNFHAHYRTHTKVKNSTRRKKGDTKPSVTMEDNQSNNTFSLLAGYPNTKSQQQKIIMTSNCSVASTVATHAAATAVAASQHFVPNTLYYNSHLYDHQRQHASSEIMNFTRNHTTAFQSCGMLNFEIQRTSPPISPVSSATSLSLLSHEISTPETYQHLPSPHSMYAFPYSSFPSADIHYSIVKSDKSSHVKPHVCSVPQCLRRFKRLEHLKRHMRIHTLERPFVCSYPDCQKRFSRSDNLAQHAKTHQKHEEKKRKKSIITK
ncbi:hypothetical protein A0J61_06221 [Choanephora cucurbitarum]|uniref:C2H2-type domain-containing protein n=1 Tax=Choanephora cucurbitarum TaxID=101091 RepID=A0A1C7N9F9_9FUNG|nr:hypothetical protein A0J61_06221 [Choanephora cucurbitarum]